MSQGEVIGAGSVYATSGLQSAKQTSGSYPKSSAGGDPTVMSPLMTRPATPSGNSYNITVSPNVNIHPSGNNTSDLRKMAREVATLLEQEIKMTMMRAS